MTYEATTTNSADTKSLAKRLAKSLKGGEIIELASDLGGGKTTFVQGMAEALGYTGEVTSPTFTLSNIYRLPGGLELHHYDLFRLNEAGVVGEGLFEGLGDPDIVTVIEWAGAVHSGLPADRLTVHLHHTGSDDRRLDFEAGGEKSARLVAAMRAEGQVAGAAEDGDINAVANSSAEDSI